MAAKMEEMKMLDSCPDGNGHTCIAQGICRKRPMETTIEMVPIRTALQRTIVFTLYLPKTDQASPFRHPG